MSNMFHRAFSANGIALSALTLSAVLAFPMSGAFAASSGKPAHARAMQARAYVPGTVACTKHGCETVPTSCRAVPQPGTEPGYQMVTCP